MIQINIPESYTPDNPLCNQVVLSDCEKFIEGFKQLCKKTNMNIVDVEGIVSCPIITKLHFEDGTYIGIRRLFEEIGFVKR